MKMSHQYRKPFFYERPYAGKQVEGKVVRLSSREMVLMTLGGNQLRIPNSMAYQSVITNFTCNPLRRFEFEVGVGVADDLKFVHIVGCEVLRDMKGVLANPEPSMRVERLGDYNVIVRFFGWVEQREADLLKVKTQAIRTVKTALEKAGITMPEPIQAVLLRQRAVDESPDVKQEPPALTATDHLLKSFKHQSLKNQKMLDW